MLVLRGGSQSSHCNIPTPLPLLTVMGYLLYTPFHAKFNIVKFEIRIGEILKTLPEPKFKPRNHQIGMLGIFRRVPRQI